MSCRDVFFDVFFEYHLSNLHLDPTAKIFPISPPAWGPYLFSLPPPSLTHPMAPMSFLPFLFLYFVCVSHGLTLDVGVLLPLSFPPSSSSLPSSQWLSALQLASTESLPLNNISINLHIKDSADSFTQSVAQCLELVNEGVQVVIGEVTEENTAAAQQFLVSNKVFPFILCLSPLLHSFFSPNN